MILEGPKGRHIQLPCQLIVPRLRRSINLDWFLIHDLTVVATSSRPFGPQVVDGIKY